MPLAPVDTDGRLQTLDILRGLALFGMILVHFHQKMRLEATRLEDLIGWGVWVLVEQKSWGVFAFLFGVGFAVPGLGRPISGPCSPPSDSLIPEYSRSQRRRV